ncbi:MAG: hypothetical protein R6V25_08995 [Desulfatiglandales bacterium]
MPISASICEVACAAYFQYVSAQPLDFLDLDKKSSFLNWKLASAKKAFMDEHYLRYIGTSSHRSLQTLGKTTRCGGVVQFG